MRTQSQEAKRVWSIVLAGGDGVRVKPFVQRWLGYHRPKQYCTFVGNRSMFEHTVDRAAQFASPEQTVVVAARHHRAEVRDQLLPRPIGKLILQPANRETGAGIFLPLSYVRARNPRAVVVIHPSDHFIHPERRFLDTLQHAVNAVESVPDHLLLLGVQPDRLETEYGWIQRGAYLDGSPQRPVQAVTSFLEKPTLAEADAALRNGALWNTLILTATVDALWEAGRACLPDMMQRFEYMASAWDTLDESSALEATYRDMPAYNFSSDLLERVPDQVAVMELTGVLWCDWGKPIRIAETLRRIGRSPLFPLDCLDRPFTPHPVPDDEDHVLASA